MKIGTVLVDRYQIREQLSRKAGRQTFLAQDLHAQDLVIIKILRFDEDFHWDDLKLFEREAATLKHLDHPAIPKYLDYFEVEAANAHGFALVQTYIEAPSLEQVVKDGRKFSEAEAIELADRLLSILTYLHAQIPPVIHRDIKPSNILLTNRSGNSVGDVYLVDFGSVQTAASREGGTITIVGSYGYMPLEQFGGQTTTASDLYSLGMTIIYLLTGTHPAELPQVNGQVKFTAEVSKQLLRWLEKMTQPHLSKRFDSARSAQMSLKSEDGNYGDFIHLKPINSGVKLHRDQNNLEIRFSSFHSFYWHWYAILSIAFITMLLLPDIWLLIGLSASFLLYIFSSCQTSKIRVVSIDRNSGILRKGILLGANNKIKWDDSVLLQCNAIEYSPNYTIDEYKNERGNFVSGKVKIDSQLYFRTQYGYKHSIFDTYIDLEPELWWLGQEISDFLDMELRIIHTTPELPPAPAGD